MGKSLRSTLLWTLFNISMHFGRDLTMVSSLQKTLSQKYEPFELILKRILIVISDYFHSENVLMRKKVSLIRVLSRELLEEAKVKSE